MSEQELAQRFINYFGEYEIYPEVPAIGIIDFVAVLGNIRTAVEVKTTFNWKVFEQAHKNRNYAHFSYIAVPHNKDSYFRERLCKDYGIGLLYYNENYRYAEFGIREVVKPKLQRKIVKVKLEDYMKESVAGSQRDRITAFGNTVNSIADYLRRVGKPVTIKRVLEDVNHHYSTNTSAKQCIVNMCATGVIKDFRHERGLLLLNSQQTYTS